MAQCLPHSVPGDRRRVASNAISALVAVEKPAARARAARSGPRQVDPHNERDFVWRNLTDAQDRAAVTVAFRPVADGLRADFPIVVAI